MAKLELEVEINDESLFAALAEVKEAQRVLSHTVAKLESRITGMYGGIIPNAAEVKEKSPTQ